MNEGCLHVQLRRTCTEPVTELIHVQSPLYYLSTIVGLARLVSLVSFSAGSVTMQLIDWVDADAQKLEIGMSGASLLSRQLFGTSVED